MLNVSRAAECYREAVRLDRLLSTDGRIVFRAMFGVYRSLFVAVEKQGTRIFTERVRTGRPRLMAAAVTTLVLGPRPTAAVRNRNPGTATHE
jgi:hypothetical protein